MSSHPRSPSLSQACRSPPTADRADAAQAALPLQRHLPARRPRRGRPAHQGARRALPAAGTSATPRRATPLRCARRAASQSYLVYIYIYIYISYERRVCACARSIALRVPGAAVVRWHVRYTHTRTHTHRRTRALVRAQKHTRTHTRTHAHTRNRPLRIGAGRGPSIATMAYPTLGPP